MLAFKITVNKERPLVAGAPDASILGLNLHAGFPGPGKKHDEQYVQCAVGGLTQDDAQGISYHFRWPRVSLQMGDIVEIELVDVDAVDAPAKRYRNDAEVRESPFTEEEDREMRYQDYLELKAEFEPSPNSGK